MDAALDTEWMKFMSRLSRQQNCDNDDASSGGDDEYIANDGQEIQQHFASETTVCSTVLAASDYQTTIVKPPTVSGSSEKPKKTCISKKAQRRTYSFLDTAVGTVSPANNTTKNNEGVDGPASPPVGVSMNSPTSSVRSKISPIYISTKTKIVKD